MKYRAEIDGLRAIAVMSVLFYHAKFYVAGHHVFSGGFIGVDIFFVISGYLISFILLREMNDQKFSIIKFYERRARRILPALFAVAAVTSAMAYYILMPSAFKEYGGSLAAAFLFVANIFFWQQDSYTAEASDFKPFLHTWSLGVEEQFYIFFPFMLFFAWVFLRQYTLWLMVFGAVVSLALAEWTSRTYQDASFYLLPTRGWELLAGSVLAWLDFKGMGSEKEGFKKALPFIGCGILGLSVLLMHDRMVHPGLITVLPILGTMLVIRYAGGGDPVSWILKCPPIVGIGLVSYSLYLWHQPIFAFARIVAIEDPSGFQKLGWIVLSIVLAVLTYWFIEKPTRDRQITSVKVMWIMSVIGTFGFLACGFYIYKHNGLPERFPGIFQKAARAEIGYGAKVWDGDLSCANYFSDKGHCSLEFGDAGATFVTIGDSHLRPLTQPLMDAFEGKDARLVPLIGSGCMFALGIDMPKRGLVACDQSYNESRLNVIESYDNPVVIFGARLPYHLHYGPFDNQEGGHFSKSDLPEMSEEEYASYAHNLSEKIRETLTILLVKGYRVVLIYPVPEVGWDAVRRFVKIAPRDEKELDKWMKTYPLSTSYDVFKQRNASAYAVYNSVPDHPNLIRIYPERLFCNKYKNKRCITMDQDGFYYRDDNHLSYDGGALLVEQILKDVREKWNLP